jgi:hypothetical protein
MLAAQNLTPDKLNVAIRDPFFIFEFHDVFDRATYDALDSQFPKKSLFPATWVDRGGKSHMNSKMPEFAEFTKKTPVWSKLYESLSDPQVVRKLYEITHSVPSERPASEKKPWKIGEKTASEGIFRKPLAKLNRLHSNLHGNTPVRLSFEFSYLEAGCYIPPHTDVAGKLISLMIYFPDKAVDYSSGAGTEFYRGRDQKAAQSGWKAGMMDDKASKEFLDKHETFYTSDFTPNKLVGFIKSSNSWHGVRKLELPPSATRRSLNVNYYLA